MTLLINYSEFNTLTDCERKWVYAYLYAEEEQGHKRGLKLGTLIHLWHSRWLIGEGATLPSVWTDDINTGGKPGEVQTFSLDDFEPELVARALWLADRFTALYGEQPPSSWTVISAEEWLTREFGWGTLVGRTDGFVEIDGQLYLIEVKSYGSKPGPLAYAQVSPQLGCYGLLAEAKFGKLPFATLYQGVHTYQWVRKPRTLKDIEAELHELHPDHTTKDIKSAAKALQPNTFQPERDPSESFEQLEVVLGAEHLHTAAGYLSAAVNRRRAIGEGQGQGLSLALPSVGAHCRSCGFKARCWNDLGGVEEFEIEVEDDEAEPV